MPPNLKFDAVLAEGRPALLPPALQVRLEKLLTKNERVLWTAQTRIITDSTPLIQIAYVLTDQRAIALPFNSDTYHMMRWKAVIGVTITRRRNRKGKLTLVSQSFEETDEFTVFKFKNCPQIERVQQIVERLLLGTDSDPFSLPESEEPEIAQDISGSEGGLPLRWRSRLEAELLPDEQLLWVGRANSQIIRKSFNSCLPVALVFVAIIVGLIVLTGKRFPLPLMLSALGLIVGLTALVLAFVNLVILNTAYAVTNRRAMQVRGMSRGAVSRTIEYYLNVKMGDVITDDTFTRNYNANYTDLILFKKTSVNQKKNISRNFEFTTIPKQEAELVKEMLQQVYRIGPKEAPRPSFGNLNPAPPPFSDSKKRRKRKR